MSIVTNIKPTVMRITHYSNRNTSLVYLPSHIHQAKITNLALIQTKGLFDYTATSYINKRIKDIRMT